MPGRHGRLILSLDIGTSSVRAMLWDERGNWFHELDAEIEHQMTVSRDGGVETDPKTLLKRTGRAIDQVLAAAGRRASEIEAVGISTFWHSLMGVDADGGPVTPLYTWADTRSQAAAEQLKQRLDEREVHAHTGCVLHSSYLPAKLLWLSESQPEAFQRAHHWLSFAEYFFFELFGRPLASISMASGTGLLDQDSCTWYEPLLAVLPISADQLGTIAGEHESASGLKPVYAKRWPSLAKIPWFPGLGDGACSNAGSNCSTSSRVALMVGTSGALRVLWRAAGVPAPDGLWRYRLDREHILVGGALSNGGNLMRWLDATVSLGGRKSALAEVAAIPADGHGLTVLPFLAGERSPEYRADARGAFVGVSLSTTPADLLRASMEAVSYRFAILARLLQPVAPDASEVIVDGGAILHRPVWLQITADVLGRRLIASSEAEATSRGAALQALASLGALGSIEEAADHLGQTYEPDGANHAVYAAAIERQQTLYDRLVSHPLVVAAAAAPTEPVNPQQSPQ